MIIGETKEGRLIAHKLISGPSSYSAGGFTVGFSELRRIDAIVASILKAPDTDNIVYKLDITVSGNQATIVVKQIDVTAAAPASWSEVANGTDLSGLLISIIAVGV